MDDTRPQAALPASGRLTCLRTGGLRRLRLISPLHVGGFRPLMGPSIIAVFPRAGAPSLPYCRPPGPALTATMAARSVRSPIRQPDWKSWATEPEG